MIDSTSLGSFALLPQEILQNVVEYMDIPTLATCCRLNKGWHSLANARSSSDIFWSKIAPKAEVDNNNAGSFEDLITKIREFANQIGANQYGELIGVFPFDPNCKFRISICYSLKAITSPQLELEQSNHVNKKLYVRLPKQIQSFKYPSNAPVVSKSFDDERWKDGYSLTKICSFTHKKISLYFIYEKEGSPIEKGRNSPEEINKIVQILKDRLTSLELVSPQATCVVS